MDDIRAVMDATGLERASLLGSSEGGPLAMLFAATYPQRTTSLVLWDSFASMVRRPGYPWGLTAEQLEGTTRAYAERWGRHVLTGVPGRWELFAVGA